MELVFGCCWVVLFVCGLCGLVVVDSIDYYDSLLFLCCFKLLVDEISGCL